MILRRSLYIKTYCTFTLLLFALIGCQQGLELVYWPEHPSQFQDTQWTIQMEDSSHVLQEKDGEWILPNPPENASQISLVWHQESKGKPYFKYLGRVDQEVIRDRGPILKEYYRFDRNGVLFLGGESSDSTRLLTLYQPPLLLLPNELDQLDTTEIHEAIPRVWDAMADTFQEEPKIRIRLTKKKRGQVRIDDSLVPALLCKMAISQDGTVGFGGTDLIVPDAVMMESYILLVKRIGPVLEWGIRSRQSESQDKKSNQEHDTLIPEESFLHEQREFYIEVTRHDLIKEQIN